MYFCFSYKENIKIYITDEEKGRQKINQAESGLPGHHQPKSTRF